MLFLLNAIYEKITIKANYFFFDYRYSIFTFRQKLQWGGRAWVWDVFFFTRNEDFFSPT